MLADLTYVQFFVLHFLFPGLPKSGGCFVSARRTFTGHHGTRLEAVIAGALEAAHHVGTGAVAADVARVAFVDVCSRMWNKLRFDKRDAQRLLKSSGKPRLTFASDAADVQ